jgi:signal transduction histidine kinase/ActR/RegA family two-component response regulator
LPGLSEIQERLAALLGWLRLRAAASGRLRLRTKFLLSLVLVIAALTFSTLLIVGRAAEEQVQKAIEQDTRNSVLTFENMRAERQLELARSAELMSTLPAVKALMADPEGAGLDEAFEGIWHSKNFDLLALADWTGKIVALHTSSGGFPVSAAQEMFEQSRGAGEQGAWWFGHGHLYQAAMRPIDLRDPPTQMHLGTVIIGREIDSKVAREVGQIALCQVAFRYGNDPVVSSFSPLDERSVSEGISPRATSGKFEIGDKRYLFSSVDLTPTLHPSLTLTVFKPYDEAFAYISQLNQHLILLGVAAVVIGGVIVFLISSTFTRPLEQLVGGVHALEEGNFGYPLGPDTGDEVSQVTGAFERLRSTLRTNEEQNRALSEQLRHSQKMEAVGRLAGGVAHDFNNLLTVIKGHSDLLELKLGSLSPVQHSVVQVKKAADRATALTRQLLAFSRMQVLQPQVLDLNAVIADVNKMMPVLLGEEIEYKFLPGERLAHIKADPSQIEQVLVNLAVNARDAMSKSGKLTVTTQNVVLDEKYARTHPPVIAGKYVLIVVADTGHGMDEKTKSRIFEPFFTTKEMGKGTGLGLSTVYGIVKQSGGYIWVDSAVNQGTRFEIFLPQTTEAVSASEQKEAFRQMNRGVGTVLLAEDEEAVRELACEFLSASGYEVIAAKDGIEALELAEQQKKSIDVLVTDVVMPRMRGTELAMRLRRAHPDIQVVYMSGYLEHNSDDAFLAGAELLQKPFSRDSLLQKLYAVRARDAAPVVI